MAAVVTRRATVDGRTPLNPHPPVSLLLRLSALFSERLSPNLTIPSG